ncbi:MAG: methyltransferase domain-containing protein [Bacteroidota bacterium]|nr:methyltransferase domain-containing protein [Bacteroidota bacterium]
MEKEIMQPGASINEQGRIQWLEKTLKKIPANSRILDAGAGEQQFRKFCTHLDYISQDFAQYKPEETGNGLQMPSWDYGKLDIVSDITSIPEPAGSFDAIMCTEVFEHIPDPISAIREFSRLLKPGGLLLITAPFCSMTHFAPYHFYSGFNRYFYEKHLSDQGFMIKELSPNGNYFDYVKQEISRISGIADVYNKQKPNLIERRALAIIHKMLTKFSKKSNTSSELLNFGFHVFAQKK